MSVQLAHVQDVSDCDVVDGERALRLRVWDSDVGVSSSIIIGLFCGAELLVGIRVSGIRLFSLPIAIPMVSSSLPPSESPLPHHTASLALLSAALAAATLGSES